MKSFTRYCVSCGSSMPMQESNMCTRCTETPVHMLDPKYEEIPLSVLEDENNWKLEASPVIEASPVVKSSSNYFIYAGIAFIIVLLILNLVKSMV